MFDKPIPFTPVSEIHKGFTVEPADWQGYRTYGTEYTVIRKAFGRNVLLRDENGNESWEIGEKDANGIYRIPLIVIEVPMSDETDRALKDFPYDAKHYDAAQFVSENGWTGFGLVMNPGGYVPYVELDNYVTGNYCGHALDTSNCEAIGAILAELIPGADPHDGTASSQWSHGIAYDYGNPKIRKAVEEIEASLSDYPSLNDDRFSEIEYENALEVLVKCYDIPEEIAPDIMRALHAAGHGDCFDCESIDVDQALTDAGYRRCDECEKTVIHTTQDDALCRGCASAETDHENCECISVYVENTPQEFFTREELAQAESDCLKRHVQAVKHGTEHDPNDVMANAALESLWKLAQNDQEAQEALGEVLAWLVERERHAATEAIPDL